MNLPNKVYIVDREPPATEYRGRTRLTWGSLRRLYGAWAHVKLFIASHRTSTFKVYEADVTWREVEL